MSHAAIKTRTEGGILEVIVDRPKANAIDRATSTAMGEIFIELRDNTYKNEVNGNLGRILI